MAQIVRSGKEPRTDGAPGVESATRRRVVGIGRLALDRPSILTCSRRRARNGIEENLGEGVLWRGEDVIGRSGLDDLAEVHHGDDVADVAHHRHVVADEQHRQPEGGTYLADHVEDRPLHGHVE